MLFVTSARELFSLMLKIREARKKIKEEKDAATSIPQGKHQKSLSLNTFSFPNPHCPILFRSV